MTMTCDDGTWHPVAPHVEFRPVSPARYRGRVARYDRLMSKWYWETCAHTHALKSDALECGRLAADAMNRANS
jgi:hypothetical protein